MTMKPVSVAFEERSRIIEGAIYKALQERATQAQVAEAIGIDGSTLSRFLSEHMPKVAGLIAGLGLKVVPVESKFLTPDAFKFLTETHERVLRTAPHMVWGDE